MLPNGKHNYDVILRFQDAVQGTIIDEVDGMELAFRVDPQKYAPRGIDGCSGTVNSMNKFWSIFADFVSNDGNVTA